MTHHAIHQALNDTASALCFPPQLKLLKWLVFNPPLRTCDMDSAGRRWRPSAGESCSAFPTGSTRPTIMCGAKGPQQLRQSAGLVILVILGSRKRVDGHDHARPSVGGRCHTSLEEDVCLFATQVPRQLPGHGTE
eukprot:TRINITY_DN40932_c0_g2_i1.p1 TRINITY_DN40932_c0_g2~~TRINITY_DN40932_c0_g2_i1.p1  ORF type:complete len:135 (-),score=13.25 TRINITY_DN40932_c0_g2_i1:191-595(-)